MNKAVDQLFVFENNEIHIFTRFAGLIFGIITFNKGKDYNDAVLVNMGIATILVDSWTFFLSLRKLNKM